MSETALGEGLRRWSIETGSAAYTAACEAYRKADGDEAKFYKAFWERLAADGDARVAALRPFFERAREDMQGSPGAGLACCSEKAEDQFPAPRDAADEMPGGGSEQDSEQANRRIPPTRQTNGGEAGSPGPSGDGLEDVSRPPPDHREAGASAVNPKGSVLSSPAREPSAERRHALGAAWKSSAAAVNRRFRWLDGLYSDRLGKALPEMTMAELRATVNRYRGSTERKMHELTTVAHIAIVARKLIDECEAQGVAQEDMRWADLLPQDKIDRFEKVWTKEKVTPELIRWMAESDERTLETFIGQHEPVQINA